MGIAGRYELVSSDKYDDYLKALGVGMIQRGVHNKPPPPTMEWLQQNGKWIQRTKTTYKTFEISFVLDEEFDEELTDGRKSKSSISLDGNTLIHKQNIGSVVSLVRREFNGNKLTTKFIAGDVVATRVYRKL